jgi:hypothetical protein
MSVQAHGLTDRAQIRRALDAIPLLSGRAQGRQKNSDEQSDDPNDDQQFDECEPAIWSKTS